MTASPDDAPLHDLDLGTRYEPRRELGRGGAGCVFLVRDVYLQKDVALKLLHAGTLEREGVREMEKEFALLSRIEHPGIARAHDFGHARDRPFFTSEFIPGEPLGLSPIGGGLETFLACSRDLAGAVSFLHASSILHLDIKPQNVIACAEPGRIRPVLIDFGLCRKVLSAGRVERIRGSLPYMAPEYEGGEPIGPWTDVYALGVTLYRLATGRFPRAGLAAQAGPAAADCWVPAPPPPSSLAPWMPEDLGAVILRCLALDPRFRFPSARELHDALGGVASRRNGAGARPPPAAPAGAARTGTRTVGREAELAAAEEFIDGFTRKASEDSIRARPATLVLSGPEGMGQTHLLREIKLRGQLRGARFFLETGYPGRLVPPGALFRFLGPNLAGEARSRWQAFLALLRRPRGRPRHDALDAERRLRWAAELARAARTVEDPLILAVDGLQHFDEVSISLLIDLARLLAAGEPADRPPLGIIAGYREEGPAEILLRKLTAEALEPGRASVVTLLPLGIEETADLYAQLRGDVRKAPGSHVERGLSLFQATGGVPAAIAALATRDVAGTPPRKAPSGKGPGREVGGHQGRLLLTLVHLGRPATFSELLRLTGMARRALHGSLEELRAAGLAAVEEETSRETRWVPGPAAGMLPDARTRDARRVHLRIARDLVLRARGEAGPELVDALHHFRRAGRTAPFLRLALPAARYLRSTAQSRAALRLLRDLIDALPRDRAAARVEASLEAAELEARLGRIDEGIRLAGEVIETARALPRRWIARAILSLAALHGRRGDFHRADSLFAEGFRIAGRGGSFIPRDEHLAFLNEHAATKAFLGEHDRALAICEAGLKLAGRARSARMREAALNFHATRGTVALRGFRFDEAARHFETALAIAEAIGSTSNRAVILNNLGIVHSQSERAEEAMRRFREAERQSIELDEGPSLAFIHGNLAVLHAKTGDFEGMERCLQAAEEVGSGAREAARAGGEEARLGRREEMFLAHHRGLSLLHRGLHAEARPAFESAMRLASTTGDSVLEAVDGVYRAETLIFEAAYSEASSELRRLAGVGPPRVARMAGSRLDFLLAMTGGLSGRGPGPRPVEPPPGPPIPALDAWDDLFLAWGLSTSGPGDAYREPLGRARRYFESHGLRPAASLATWVDAEASFLRGELEDATASLRSLREGSSDLVKAMAPGLEARIILEDPRGGISRAADLLAEGGSLLAGMRLPEWRLRMDCARAAISTAAACERKEAMRDLERRRSAMALEVPAGARTGYGESWHWKRWSECLRRPHRPGAPAPPRRKSESPSPRPPETHTTTRTVELRSLSAGGLRGRIVAVSPAMRRLAEMLDRLRGSELPGVIQGETGTGKEMMARVIHAESRRYGGPFLVVDLRAIPASLLEVELFGARAGAFTDLAADRPGLLAAAAGGTVLIEEIGEAGPELQAKLLRVLSGGTARAIGSDDESRIDVRFLFSTSKGLDAEVAAGRFRSDLYHRVKVVSLDVPPLRERVEDIPGLIDLFLGEGEEPRPAIDAEVVARLKELPWPGNVRELRNLVARWRLEHPRRITSGVLARSIPSSSRTSLFPGSLLSSESLSSLQERLEREYLRHHFLRLGGDAAALSRHLGVSRKHLYRRLKGLGISARRLAREEG